MTEPTWTDLAIAERSVRPRSCPDCGSEYDYVAGSVTVRGADHARYFAACHGHPDHVAQIDVILGSWTSGSHARDRVQFACLLRPNGARAVDAPAALDPADPVLGVRLSREQALGHVLAPVFWTVIDLLAARDLSVIQAVTIRPD
jgi:hypothetical protein